MAAMPLIYMCRFCEIELTHLRDNLYYCSKCGLVYWYPKDPTLKEWEKQQLRKGEPTQPLHGLGELFK